MGLHHHPDRRLSTTVASVVLALSCFHSGCASQGGDFAFRSDSGEAAMAPSFITAVYAQTDRNTVDVFLSDLPASRFTSSTDLADATGSLVHIHLFLVPKAGRTPIDDTACNVSIRHAVLVGGGGGAGRTGETVGLYGGGGFVQPGGKPGGDTFRGSIQDATLRLIRADPGFADRLGPSVMSGRFAAAQNPELARAIEAHFEALTRDLPAVAGAGEVMK